MEAEATEITATELARSLSDVLNRVRYRKERFVVKRNGEPVAVISAAGFAPGPTWREFVSLLATLPEADDEFAADLEAVRAAQGLASAPEWPS